MKTQDRTPLWLPTVALVFGILAVSMAAILVRWANAPATVMGFWRMLIAALVMSIPFSRAIGKSPVISSEARNLRADAKSSVTRHLPLAILAGFFFALNLAAWNMGALNTTAANVTLLGNLSVVWVPLATMFVFKRKLRSAFWLGLVCAMIGAIIILGQDMIAHPALGVGDLWGIASSFVYTVYLLAMEQARKQLSALVAWWTSTATSVIIMLALSLALGAPLTGYPLASFIIFAIMALVIQIGGFLSLNYAQGHLPAPLVAASMLAQPVLTAILAVPLLGQSLVLVQVIGGVLVLAGIVIVHRSRV
jgi:drug/metabolite transporter (DMT)-like permease